VEFFHDGLLHAWSDLRERIESVHDEHLSNNKLGIKNAKLSFDFPFYGHMVKNATLTTGGNKACANCMGLNSVACNFK